MIKNTLLYLIKIVVNEIFALTELSILCAIFNFPFNFFLLSSALQPGKECKFLSDRREEM